MKRIEMIGSPLAHVKTPGLLNALLVESGADRRVTLRETGLSGLPSYVAATRRDRDVVGLVVTTPLKQAICGHLARKTALVELIGACNCVRFDDGSWIGANFDGLGVSRALAEAGVGLAGKRVLLMGCGGAGKAIAARILEEGAAELVIDDPAREQTAAFVTRLRAGHVGCGIAPESGCFDIVINASSLGMHPDDPSPVPLDVIAQCDVAVDIVIAPALSRFTRQARGCNKILVDGAAVVRGQLRALHAFLLSDASSELDAAAAVVGRD